jgi:hypothetical protein
VRNLLLGIPVVGPWLYALTSPIGLAAVGVVAFFVWLGIHDSAIRRDAIADCRADELRRTIAELERQNNALEEALQKSLAEDAKDDKELEKLRTEAAKPAVSVGPCEFDPADVERLRNIK